MVPPLHPDFSMSHKSRFDPFTMRIRKGSDKTFEFYVKIFKKMINARPDSLKSLSIIQVNQAA